MIAVVTASTLLAYAFYTISPDTIAKFHTDLLGLTLPFPLYGIFRTSIWSTSRRGRQPFGHAPAPTGRCCSAWRSGARW